MLDLSYLTKETPSLKNISPFVYLTLRTVALPPPSKVLYNPTNGILDMAVSGYLMIFIAYVVWAISTLFVKKAVTEHSPVLVTAIMSLAGAMVLLPVIIAQRREVVALPALSWVLLIGGGILWIPLGQVIATYGIERVNLSKAGFLALSFPIILAGLSFLFLDEKLTLRFFLGSVVMAIGFVIVAL